MALNTLPAGAFADDAITSDKINLANTFAFTGTVTGAAKIAQVVQTYKTDAFSTTSTSYVDVTGVSVAITPSATSSKILIQFTGTANQSVAGWNLYTQLLRGSTVVGSGVGSSNSVFAGALFAGNAYVENLTGIYLDSPSTTSETTYKLQAKVGANTGYFGRRGDSSADVWPTSITAMEILG
jgi:predicted membrane protein